MIQLSSIDKNLIKQLLPGQNIVDIFLYDTKKDIDGGAWRNDKNAQMTSWYNETLNTATRGSKREFPEVAIIVCYITNNQNRVIIYDASDLSMWIVFGLGTGNCTPFNDWTNTNFVRSGFMLKGRLFVAMTLTTNKVDFKTEECGWYRSNTNIGWVSFPINIAERNGSNGIQNVGLGDALINNACNCVHGATIEGIDYIAVATDGGVSLINMTTSRIASFYNNPSQPICKKVNINSEGTVIFSNQDATPTTSYVAILPLAHMLTNFGSVVAVTSTGYIGIAAGTSVYSCGAMPTASSVVKDITKKNNTLLVGTDGGVVVAKHSQGSPYIATRLHTNKAIIGISGQQGGRWISGFDSGIDESGGLLVDHKGIGTGMTKTGTGVPVIETTGTFGKLKGYTFNGTSWFSVPSYSYVNFNGAYTLWTVVNLASLSASWQALLSKFDVAANSGYFLQVSNSGIDCSNYQTGSYQGVSSSVVLPTNKLVFLVLTQDGTNLGTGFKIYMNGVRLSLSPYSNYAGGVTGTSSGPFNLGGFSNTTKVMTNGSIMYGAGSSFGEMSEEAVQEMWKQIQSIKKQSPELADMCLKGNSNYVNGVDLDDNGNVIYATGDGSNTGIVAKYDPDNLTHVETLSGVSDSYGSPMSSTKFNNVKFLSHDLVGIAGQSDVFLENFEKGLINKDKDDKKLMADILRKFPKLQIKPREYDFSASGLVTDTNWVTAVAKMIPYKTANGSWRMLLDISGYYSVSTIATGLLSIKGIVFQGYRCVSWGNGGESTYIYRAVTNSTTSQLYWKSAANIGSGGNTTLYFSGDVLLTGKPEKTYFPFIDEMDF